MSTDLFSTYNFGGLTLPNRTVMAPMTRSRAKPGNVVHELQAEYYAQRASAGLIITEGTQVSQQGIGYVRTPGIHTDEQIAAWKKVTDAVHAAGGRIAAQLWHVGRVSHTSFQPDGGAPVAPSAIGIAGQTWTAEGQVPFSTPRALDIGELPGIAEQFAHGARAAKAAGFDAVEIHGANGYLLDQFLRDGSNHRSDAYGGSIANRARLGLEVADAVVAVWGADKVGYRISPFNPSNDMSDSNPARTFEYIARALGERKLGYLHVMEKFNPDDSNRLTPTLREAFRGTLIANIGYDRDSADAVIARGDADLVAFGVPFLANPDLPARLKNRWPLNAPDFGSFYTEGPKGYTDYPTYAS